MNAESHKETMLVGHSELECIAIGAAVLGTGGGGDPYVGKLWAQTRIRERGPVQLLPVDELPDEGLVIAAAMMDAPSVIMEKIPSGAELARAFRAVLGTHRPKMGAEVAAEAYALAMQLLERGLERMRPSSESLATIAVGCGSVLLPECLEDGPIQRPSDFLVANAIGAAISEVSGSVDRLVAIGDRRPRELRDEVEEEARLSAGAAGADPAGVRIAVWEEIPIAYLPGNAIRLRAKAAGRMAPVA